MSNGCVYQEQPGQDMCASCKNKRVKYQEQPVQEKCRLQDQTGAYIRAAQEKCRLQDQTGAYIKSSSGKVQAARSNGCLYQEQLRKSAGCKITWGSSGKVPAARSHGCLYQEQLRKSAGCKITWVLISRAAQEKCRLQDYMGAYIKGSSGKVPAARSHGCLSRAAWSGKVCRLQDHMGAYQEHPGQGKCAGCKIV
eukprot:1160071-Pelagomonas_calceolata.AAC.6